MATMANPLSHDQAASSKRRHTRRSLPLLVHGRENSGAALEIQIFNISETGVLIECEADLVAGDSIQLDLPHAGTVRARIVWTSGSVFGCQFDTPVSPATLSAAQLQSAVGRHLNLDIDDSASTDHFGARLQRLRIRKGLSQTDIAAHLGVSAPSISGWEKGRTRPKHARLDALAELLGVAQSDLTEEPEPEGIHELVERSRDQIARAMSTTPDKIHITVEL